MRYLSDYLPPLSLMVVIILSLLLVTACGCGQSNTTSTASQSAASAAPTMPSGRFQAVGEQSILTSTVALTTTTATTETATAAPDVSRGEMAYTKNKCGDCHGAAGEGVADKGEALTAMTLSLEEFDSILRTGGGLGNSHIFGRSAVSPSGMEALYAYVQSLGQ